MEALTPTKCEVCDEEHYPMLYRFGKWYCRHHDPISKEELARIQGYTPSEFEGKATEKRGRPRM